MTWQEIITKSVRMVSYKEGERENRGRRMKPMIGVLIWIKI